VIILEILRIQEVNFGALGKERKEMGGVFVDTLRNENFVHIKGVGDRLTLNICIQKEILNDLSLIHY